MADQDQKLTVRKIRTVQNIREPFKRLKLWNIY